MREAKIRTTWPTLLDVFPPLANLGAWLIGTRFLAPLGWMVMAPLFMKKLVPFTFKRYVLTNRQVMIQRGAMGRARDDEKIALADIDEIRLEDGSYHPFFHSANLEFYKDDKCVLKLTAVPEPQGFRNAILNAMTAWVPEKAKAIPWIPAETT